MGTEPTPTGPVGTETHWSATPPLSSLAALDWYTLLLEDLKSDEGFRAKVYNDHDGIELVQPGWGNYTIGYGTNLSIGITQQEATLLLVYRVNRAIEQIQAHYHWFDTLSDNRKRAVTNMVYTLGMTKFVGFVEFIFAMSEQDYTTAAAEIVNSAWYSSKAHARAERIRLMILSG